MNWLSFGVIYLVPISVFVGYWLGGVYTFFTPVLVFGLVPILDILIGKDLRNPTSDEEARLEGAYRYRILTWLCAPLQVGMVFWGAWIASVGGLSALEWFGFVVSLGISSGVMGINVAHELVHRVNNRLEPVLGKIMLWTVFYIHWGIEHVVGHHRHVATPEDPATSRLGESLYLFLPRSIWGAFRKAWTFEASRLQKQGRFAFGYHNRVIVGLGTELALLLLVFFVFGVWSVCFVLIQALVGILLLEAVNYIEHYGLLRERNANDTYNAVTPIHSWNSSHWLTNRFLFNLQRHSDHHYLPGRRYHLLRHYDESPQLPTGYAGMILIAVIPPLWRRLNDPKIEILHNQALKT